MNPMTQEWLAAFCLALTLIHSFNAGFFARFKTPFLHALSEIEIIFTLWGLVFLTARFWVTPVSDGVSWLQGLSFSEPLFVIAIMVIASTKPILNLAQSAISGIAGLLPLKKSVRESKIPLMMSLMTLGPLLGSLITEPAAMTVSALILNREILGAHPSKKLLYSSIATLFVNVSIGGVLTAFAAPPVLMVAHAWDWNTSFMLSHFGLRSTLAVVFNSILLISLNRSELKERAKPKNKEQPLSIFILFLNLAFLLLTILLAHHVFFLIGAFMALYAYLKLTLRHQGGIHLKSALMVGGFLMGLTLLTADQSWWLTPLISKLNSGALFLGATFLTAITDNAALTSLAARVQGLPIDSRYLIVAGAVTGGGLTLIANAPNPAGYSILKTRFGPEGISPSRLFLSALPPTLIAGALLWKA